MAKLQLAVKNEYFVSMKSGEKLEEYRQVTEYWKKRLYQADGSPQNFDSVIITDGYPKAGDPERTLEFPWRGFERRTITHPHFGPDPVEVFAIAVRPSPATRVDNQPRYTTKRLHDEIARAKASARFEALNEAASIAAEFAADAEKQAGLTEGVAHDAMLMASDFCQLLSDAFRELSKNEASHDR